MNARYAVLIAALSRVHAWNVEASARVQREAAKAIGHEFEYCLWHNASVSWDSGRPWAEWGREQQRAYKRFLYQQQRVWDTARNLTDSIYRKAIDAQVSK